MQRRTYKTGRTSGSFKTPFTSIDLSDLSETTEDRKNREEMLRKKLSKGNCYKVTFKDQENLVFISFQKTPEKARSEACLYFRDNFYPSFMDTGMEEEYMVSTAHRLQAFDKYSIECKVPIPDLMKELKATFPCSVCGKDNFNLQDVEIGRCFIVEGEGDLNPFTKGYVLCYDCYKKYIVQK